MTDKNEIVITVEGKEELEKELRNLIDVERPLIIEQLQNARAMGDLSENADYSSAKDKQAEIENRIKSIETILNKATVIKSPKKASSTVKISNTVTYLNMEKNVESTVQIVSTIEADPFGKNNGAIKVSNVSPLGQALIGKSVNDVVTVEAKKPYEIKIIEIK